MILHAVVGKLNQSRVEEAGGRGLLDLGSFQ